jgi:hypothetical protein
VGEGRVHWWIGGGVSVSATEAAADCDAEEQAEGCHAHEIPGVLFDRSVDVLGDLGVRGVECHSGLCNQRLDDRAGGVIVGEEMVDGVGASGGS